MTKKLDKELVYLAVAVITFLVIIVVVYNYFGQNYPDYSVLNKSQTGYSIFYESLKREGYQVDRTLEAPSEHQAKTVQLIVRSNSEFDLASNPQLEEWIKQGGVAVILAPKLDLEVLEVGSGTVIKIDRSVVTNDYLLEDTSRAYSLVAKLADYEPQTIYFNEHNLFQMSDTKNLWDITPLLIKVLIYQLALVAIAFLYYQGRRFGKPKPLVSEVERSENEYLHSAAALYYQAECWDLLVEYYYNDFLNSLAYSQQNWLELWQQKDLPEFNKAKQLQQSLAELEEDVTRKEALKIISDLEELQEILNKRRDQYWNRLQSKN
ncbi:MAG: hypothetical protein ACQEP9_03760 [Bacillota bacterium]